MIRQTRVGVRKEAHRPDRVLGPFAARDGHLISCREMLTYCQFIPGSKTLRPSGLAGLGFFFVGARCGAHQSADPVTIAGGIAILKPFEWI